MIEKSDDIPPTENFEFATLQKAENYRAALAQEFSPFLKGSVVEVGAGIGQFSSTLAGLPSIEQLLAVEPEVRFCNTFRRLHPELTLIEGTFDKLPADSEWDAIVSVNVLEHIREDDAELAKYRKSLVARRGHLCLFVPARQEIYAPLDKDFGHYRRYARKELLRKLEQTGYVIVRLSYFNFFGYFAWWFNFCVLKKRRFDVRSVVVFDRFIFPLVHGFERHFLRPPFGQSLLVVAQAGGTIGNPS